MRRIFDLFFRMTLLPPSRAELQVRIAELEDEVRWLRRKVVGIGRHSFVLGPEPGLLGRVEGIEAHLKITGYELLKATPALWKAQRPKPQRRRR